MRALGGHPITKEHERANHLIAPGDRVDKPQKMWSLQPSLAQDVEFLREICRVLVGL
jgi:hypothetical protein